MRSEVAVEDEDVPAEHRTGEVEDADARNQVPEAVGAAEIHGDEGEAHQDGGDRKKLAEDDEVVEVLVLVDVDRDDEHHGRGRHADEEGEVGDVDAPRDLVAHAGDLEARDELLRVGIEPDNAEDREGADQA